MSFRKSPRSPWPSDKGLTSVLIYAVAIPLSFVNVWLAISLYAVVAMIWLIPDRRIEKTLRT